MTQNPTFNLDSPTVEPLFGTVGVMEVSGAQEYKTAVTEVYYDSNEKWAGVYVVLPNAEIKYFDLDKSQVSLDPQFTGSLLFQDAQGNSYYLRKVQDVDGYWMSKYQTELPVVALEKKILIDSNPAVESLFKLDLPPSLPYFETMVFYYEPEVEDILELAYLSSAGTYVRRDADWVLASLDSEKYEGLYVYEVDPKSANKAVQEFDEKGRISIKEAPKYSLQF